MQLEKILKELAWFLEPILEISANEVKFTNFIDRLGYEFVGPDIQRGFDALSLFIDTASSLFRIDTASQPELDPEAILEIVNSLRVFTEIGFEKKQGDNNFFEDLLGYLLYRYLARGKFFVFAILASVGVVERKLVTVVATNEQFFEVKFAWDKAALFIENIEQWAKIMYGWAGNPAVAGEKSLDYSLLTNNLILLFESSGWLFGYAEKIPLDEIPGTVQNAPVDELLVRANIPVWQSGFQGADENGVPIFAIETGFQFLPYGNFNASENLGFSLAPYLKGEINQSFDVTDKARVEIAVSAEAAGGMLLVVRPSGISNEAAISASAGIKAFLHYGNQAGGAPLTLIDENEIKSSIQGAKIGVGSDTNGELYVSAGVDGFQIQFDFSDNPLLGNFISEPFDVNIGTLGISWRYGHGVNFEGGNSLEVVLPLHIDLGFLNITASSIGLNLVEPSFQVAINGNLNLGVVVMSVESVGLKASFPKTENGLLGNRDIALDFKPPNGIGLSIDAGVVKGGGYLFFDFDREEYAGALELIISEWIAVKAVGLITTRLPDGSKGFSMVIIISVEFGTGIQLGLGFTLLGVGGLLGLNRTVNIDPLAEGVRTGAVENIMFPQDVVANAPRIISDLRTFFPAKDGQFLIGPMAKIGYGTPTLVSLTLGVIIEFPDVSITILGVLKVALPDENAEVLKLQVNFIGRIEPSNKLLWFEARLFDSRILFMTIEGGMGLLVKWGDDSNFVFSVGGFHPRYNPPPLPFPEPPRLAITILNESYARIRIEGYFALTSNTVQFGARAELYFGFSFLNVDGHLSFDALFQFDPFYFIFEFSVGMSVKFFGFGLFSLSVSGLLEGPTRWHIKGKARWKITWFGPTIKVNIDETWGEDVQTELPPIDIFPLIEREFDAITNWEAVVPNNSSTLVTLRQLGDDQTPPSEDSETETRLLVLHPVGTLRISQRKVPIELVLDKFGNQRPADVNHFSVSANIPGGGGLAIGEVREQFAPAEFKDIDNSKKLSSPGFESYKSGIEIRPEGDQFQTSMAVKRNIRYETNIIDNNYKRFTYKFFSKYVAGFTVLLGTLFTHFLKGSVVTKSTLSKHYQDQIQPNIEVIQVLPNQFSVANTQNNRPVLDGDGQTMNQFSSQMEATDFMKGQISQNPGLAAQMHVIPNTEINTAA